VLKVAFEKVAREINENMHVNGSGSKLYLDEIVYGRANSGGSSGGAEVDGISLKRFIKVTNETMCRPIRALTKACGHATSRHM
jgi:5-oxoprolinase (ATP-hydrolysing)